jgi:S1-C subfamily serine protease
MSDVNKNKEENGFSFIQEQIVPYKKSRWKRMLFSFLWTIILAGVFGLVAIIVFTVMAPPINSWLGKAQDKKTVEFPSEEPEDSNLGNFNPDSTEPDNNSTPNGVGIGTQEEEETSEQTETVIIENTIKADIEDLNSMYGELRAIASEVNKSMVTITSIVNGVDWFNNEYEAEKVSTGFIVGNNGQDLLILVNSDRMEDAKDIQITFYNSIKAKGRLQSVDYDLKLAAIAVSLEEIPDIDRTEIRPATLGESYSLIIGTPVIAMGSPNGYAGSMEFGTITSKGAQAYITDNRIDLFTTNITDYDNGYGIIINLRGEIIGIITQTLMEESYEEVNTAIGISRIKNIIATLVNNKEQVYFGIKGLDMTEESLKSAEVDNGVSVREVEADSPALKAGIQSGDIIMTVNETPINSMNSFYAIISGYQPKTEIEVVIRRNAQNENKDINVTVILEKKK